MVLGGHVLDLQPLDLAQLGSPREELPGLFGVDVDVHQPGLPDDQRRIVLGLVAQPGANLESLHLSANQGELRAVAKASLGRHRRGGSPRTHHRGPRHSTPASPLGLQGDRPRARPGDSLRDGGQDHRQPKAARVDDARLAKDFHLVPAPLDRGPRLRHHRLRQLTEVAASVQGLLGRPGRVPAYREDGALHRPLHR